MHFKKGITLGEAPQVVLTMVFIALIAIVGQKIMTATQVGEYVGNDTVINTTTAAYAAAGNTSLGIAQITSQLSLVGLIVIMAIVIGVLWSSFRFGGNQGM